MLFSSPLFIDILCDVVSAASVSIPSLFLCLTVPLIRICKEVIDCLRISACDGCKESLVEARRMLDTIQTGVAKDIEGVVYSVEELRYTKRGALLL